MEIHNRKYKIKTNLNRRIAAAIIDYGLYFILSYFYIDAFGHSNDDGGKTISGFLLLPLPLFWLIYFVVVEGVSGATLGHHNMNLLVLTTDREKIGITESLQRHLLDLIDLLPFGIPASIAISNTEKHQRLGDLWANTIVVDIKDHEQYDEQAN